MIFTETSKLRASISLVEVCARQGTAPNRAPDGVGDRVSRCARRQRRDQAASRHHCKRISPSLRLAHLLADAGKLDVEGVKSEEVVAGIEPGANKALA